MGIDVPELDDREFEEIFEAARRQIPVHTEEWTDHNTHDTGIAILEMLAWISETYTYQLDRISEADREKYLKLLGVSRRAPEPARANISVSVPAGAGGETIEAGEQLVVDDRSGITKTFETTDDVVLVEADLDRIVTYAGDDTVNNTRENETDNTHFYPFGKDPDVGDTLYLGFDRDPFATADRLELAVAYHDEDLPPVATHGDYESTFEPSVELTWQYCQDYARWRDDDAWVDVPVASDTTDSFYNGGRVTLTRPPGWSVDRDAVDAAELLGQPSGLVWLRCRVETPGYEVPPQFNSIGLNVLEISHQQRIVGELLRRDDESLETGVESNQTFLFEHAPVLDATITVDGTEWTEVDDLDTSGPQDRHYELDRQNGAVVFGNGIDGAKPPIGTEVVAKEYRHGGGTAGNVSDAAEWSFRAEDRTLAGVPLSDVSVEALGPATGGRSMESIDDAMDRFKTDLKIPYRAATLEDYGYIASHTPGLRFGRATATTERRQLQSGEEIREIHVTVVPYSTQREPEPSEGFLAAVEDHLDRCRLLTDVVHVQEPEYVTIGMQVTVTALPGYDDWEVRREVTDELQSYFHPITGYGGEGWPFGRPLYISEVEDVLAVLSSVQSVESVSVSAGGNQRVDDYGNILIDETALLSVSEADITVTVQEGTTDGSGW